MPPTKLNASLIVENNPMTKQIKAVLFDMDGVLVEAKDWHYEAFNKALEVFGLPISRSEHLSIYDGLPTKDKLKILTTKKGLPEELHGFLNSLKQAFTRDVIVTSCHPVFNVEYALSRLHAEGYKIAVCSNSIRASIEMMMEKSALLPYIDCIVSNQDVTKGKPSPEMYLKAMANFGLKPEECLILEDNENGIRAARASGGNLLVIGDVSDTNYTNIRRRIDEIEVKE